MRGKIAPPMPESETLPPTAPVCLAQSPTHKSEVFVAASCWVLKQSKPVTWNVITAKELCSLPHPICILHTNS